jgi:hypothetical protein
LNTLNDPAEKLATNSKAPHYIVYEHFVTISTVHTNTTLKLHVFVYFLLHVSAIHIDHLQVEKYGYRRKSATAEVFSFCTSFSNL